MSKKNPTAITSAVGSCFLLIQQKPMSGDGGNTSIDYGGSTTPEVITTTVTATPSPNEVSTATLDGLGRTVATMAPNGATVNTTYNAWGQVASISNPKVSAADPTYTTYFGYDALGRKVSQTQQDGSSLIWSYTGSTTDSYDENGTHTQTKTDALKRLTRVMQFGTTVSPLNLETDYLYDSSGNLTVNQLGVTGESTRTRNFVYDSLSRLAQAYNPETGWVCYGTTGGAAPNGTNCTPGYDANGNLRAKTVRRGLVSAPYGVTTTYTYDALNRLTGKSYSDATPPVTYNYDEKTVPWSGYGLANTTSRLSSTSVGGANPYIEHSYSYDALGRLIAKHYLMPTLSSSSGEPSGGQDGQDYDLAGNVIFKATGTGLYLYEARDAAGRATSVTANKSSITLFSNATYTPWGAPSSRLLGNGLTETRTYDNRERVTSISQCVSSGSSSQCIPGSTVSYSASVGQYAPNGNVLIANDSVNGNWIYQYDSLNRLTGASSSSGLNLSWTYDSFGNRWSQTASGSGSAPQPSFTFTGNNNQTDPSNGLVYDAGGNVLIDNLNQAYTYDAEGRITSASLSTGGSATYQYDFDGQLVYETGGSGSQVFVRDTDGSPEFIYAANGTTGPYYDMMAYVDGELIGTWQAQNFRWAGKDWLGTKRYESKAVGDSTTGITPVYVNSYQSLPFGDALSSISPAKKET